MNLVRSTPSGTDSDTLSMRDRGLTVEEIKALHAVGITSGDFGLSYETVAVVLGISTRTVRWLVATGKLRVVRHNARVVRIPLSELSRIRRERDTASPSPKRGRPRARKKPPIAATRHNSSQLPIESGRTD